MRDRTRLVHGKDAAESCGGRDPRRLAWPAPPPPQLRHGIGQAVAATRGGEQP